MTHFHITYEHSPENCMGIPNPDKASMELWKQIEPNAKKNNVKIEFFKMNPTEHKIFMLLEADNYVDIEKTIGQCKKTGVFSITPVIDWSVGSKLNE